MKRKKHLYILILIILIAAFVLILLYKFRKESGVPAKVSSQITKEQLSYNGEKEKAQVKEKLELKQNGAFNKIETTPTKTILAKPIPAKVISVKKSAHKTVKKLVLNRKHTMKKPQIVPAHLPLKKTPRISPAISALKNAYDHLFASFGIENRYLSLPVFQIGTLGVSKSPLIKLRPKKSTPQIIFAIERQFINRKNSILTKLFGDKESLAFEAHYSRFHQSKIENLPYGTTGKIWFIDGRGSIYSGIYNVRDPNLKVRHIDYGMGIYFKSKGKKNKTNSRITTMPYVGLIYNNISDRYKYLVQYETSPGIFFTNGEKYELNTDYFGAAIGDRLNFCVTKKLTAFAELKLQGLFVNADLNAHQNTEAHSSVIVPVNLSKIHDDYSSLTYGAKGLLGLNYKFTGKLGSPSVELQAGIDHLGNYPKIITPTAKGEKTHLDSEAINTEFVALNLRLPIA